MAKHRERFAKTAEGRQLTRDVQRAVLGRDTPLGGNTVFLVHDLWIEIDFDDPIVANVFKLIQVWPIDFEIATTSCKLDFESDPADELIAATSVIHNIPLLTRDKTVSRSKLVPLA